MTCLADRADCSLTTGRVGHLSITYLVEAAAQVVTALTTRGCGHDTDEIRLKERLVLAGEASRWTEQNPQGP
jgi:uncharacterized protein